MLKIKRQCFFQFKYLTQVLGFILKQKNLEMIRNFFQKITRKAKNLLLKYQLADSSKTATPKQPDKKLLPGPTAFFKPFSGRQNHNEHHGLLRGILDPLCRFHHF